MKKKIGFSNKKATKRLQFEYINALNILHIQLNEKRKMEKSFKA